MRRLGPGAKCILAGPLWFWIVPKEKRQQLADSGFESPSGRRTPSRPAGEAVRQALGATSVTQAYRTSGRPLPERTTRKRPRLRLVGGGASDTGGAERWYTIADVAQACGLPQPVIAQLVPRTWTEDGWLYTGGQLQSAIQIAEEIRAQAD